LAERVSSGLSLHMPFEATSERATGSSHPDEFILFPYGVEPGRVRHFRIGPIGEPVKRPTPREFRRPFEFVLTLKVRIALYENDLASRAT